MTTLTIMRSLPREVDPSIYHMLHEDPGNISYSDIGGLNDQIREVRETIELPLTNPGLFERVGIKPPKVSATLETNTSTSRKKEDEKEARNKPCATVSMQSGCSLSHKVL